MKKTATEDVSPAEQAAFLVARLSRTQGYPKEPIGVEALADGLLKASVRTQVPMRAIVERCSEASKFCPTDAELLTIAVELRDAERNRNPPDLRAQWEKQYGPPKAIKPNFVTPDKREDDELWKALRKKFPGKWPDWRILADAAEELGYAEYAAAWRKRDF